jgi:N-acetylglutamate synthase-like GNAT family acetyltransferase
MDETPLIPVSCSKEHFVTVKKHIQQFELDDRSLKREEFLILKLKNKLLGFGRIREFSSHSELCSLGILSNQRSKGFGKLLCEALIKKANHPLFLVCIIPDYFKKFGFEQSMYYPAEINEKLNYCTSVLVVNENYVAMKLGADF